MNRSTWMRVILHAFGRPGFDPQQPMQVGGQAVIEGVMMRAPGSIATAVRRANGAIEIRKEPFQSVAERLPFLKLPVLRGAVGLIEMLAVGIRTLNFSAEMAMEDERGDDSKKPGTPVSARRERIMLALTVTVALAAGLAIFFVTPLLLATAFLTADQDPLAFNVVAGIVRLVLFLGYLLLIAQMKDVRRLFAYHGAEHKAVFAFEMGAGLNVESVRPFPRFHPRCGTSFLLIVMLTAIVLFGFLDALVLLWLGHLSLWTRLATHLPLLPLVGGISYEFIKVSARASDTTMGRIIVAPGLWLQRITTHEPDDAQIEVALAALRAALGELAATESTPIVEATAANA